MTAYVAKLAAEVLAVQAERKQEAAETARERLSPLGDRLDRLLATIPTETQMAGLSLHGLQSRLKGRWRGSCHVGELGALLRRRGFKRVRRTLPGKGYCARWFPVAPHAC